MKEGGREGCEGMKVKIGRIQRRKKRRIQERGRKCKDKKEREEGREGGRRVEREEERGIKGGKEEGR